ncbi:small integral membrane protein 26 [Phaenicophaeus curvirostris]|uniref:small integral membrane protein 26 n=1 Tax=Phaenicophaeus curvirostris TaxID=33595 RepID=UPI0037F0D389
MRPAVWNARAALLYSLGGWTLLGAMLHYNSTSTGTESGGSPENEEDPQANQGPRREIFTRQTFIGEVTTIITYKEELPPITRLLRRVKSFFDSSDSPPSED